MCWIQKSCSCVEPGYELKPTEWLQDCSRACIQPKDGMYTVLAGSHNGSRARSSCCWYVKWCNKPE